MSLRWECLLSCRFLLLEDENTPTVRDTNHLQNSFAFLLLITPGVNSAEAHKIKRAILRVELHWTTSLRRQFQPLPLPRQDDQIPFLWLQNILRSQFRDTLSSYV